VRLRAHAVWSSSKLRPRASSVALALLCAYLVLVLVSSAWVRVKMFDDRALEAEIYDTSWLLQLPWRAAHGEWVGRDFIYPMGPLWQGLSWVAAGFGFHSPARTLAGMDCLFPLVSLAIAGWIVFRHLRRPWTRVCCFAAYGAFVLYAPLVSVRYMTSLLVVFLVARPDLEPSEAAPSWRDSRLWRWALSVSLAMIAAMLLSFERGVMACASLFAISAYDLLVRRFARVPLAATVRRYVAVVVALVSVVLACMLVARLLGASFSDYIAQSIALSKSYTTGMGGPFVGVKAQSVYAVFACGAVAALTFSSARFRDVHAGAVVVGTLPLVVTALVRSDVGHAWQGIAPTAAALSLVALAQAEQLHVGRLLLCGVPAIVMLLGWYGRFGQEAKERMSFLQAWRVAIGVSHPEPRYRTNLTRVRAWARKHPKSPGTPCIGFFQGADVMHALVDIPGPTETMLRWSPELQKSLADRIRRDRCPYFVDWLTTFVYGAQNFFIGEDFTTIAEMYRPVERLGPAVFAMERRPLPLPARERDARARDLGVWREVSIPGKLDVYFDRPLEETDLVRIDYTIETPEWVRYLGGAPASRIAFSEGDKDPWVDVWVSLHLNHRIEQLVAVHPWAAEWRWLAGVGPRKSRKADRMTIELIHTSDFNPRKLRVKIHSIEVLSAGSPEVDRAPGSPISEPDLIEAVHDEKAYVVSTSAHVPPGEKGFVLPPNVHRDFDANVYFPLRPALGAMLDARIGLDRPPGGGGGDGADVEIELIDPRGHPLRTSLARIPLEPNSEPTDVSMSLDPWAGLDVLLRIGSSERVTADYDWIRVSQLAIKNGPPTLAGEFRAGLATVENSQPELDGPAIYLHPNAVGSPTASVMFPMRPAPDDCLSLAIQHRGPGGDGVLFGIAVRDGDSSSPLLHDLVLPNTTRSIPGLSLSEWADRDVRLVLSTEPGGDSAYDWAHFVDARVAPGTCGPVRSLPDLLRRDPSAVRAGRAEVVNQSIAAHVGPDDRATELAFELQPDEKSCLFTSLRQDGSSSAPLRFELYVEDAGRHKQLLSRELSAGQVETADPQSLARFSGRRVTLVFRVSAGAVNADAVGFFDSPVMRSCEPPAH
jgi:hypothetical protein